MTRRRLGGMTRQAEQLLFAISVVRSRRWTSSFSFPLKVLLSKTKMMGVLMSPSSVDHSLGGGCC